MEKCLSFFKRKHDKTGYLTNIDDLINNMKKASSSLESRSKSDLPVLCGAVFAHNNRSSDGVVIAVNSIILDYDHCNVDNLNSAEVWDKLNEDKNILMAFISPSGTGLKIIVNTASDSELLARCGRAEFAARYDFILEKYSSIYDEYLLDISEPKSGFDRVTKDIRRLCFFRDITKRRHIAKSFSDTVSFSFQGFNYVTEVIVPKETTQILDIIGNTVSLETAFGWFGLKDGGSCFMGHDSKSGENLFINKDKFKCFNCGITGDVLDFITLNIAKSNNDSIFNQFTVEQIINGKKCNELTHKYIKEILSFCKSKSISPNQLKIKESNSISTRVNKSDDYCTEIVNYFKSVLFATDESLIKVRDEMIREISGYDTNNNSTTYDGFPAYFYSLDASKQKPISFFDLVVSSQIEVPISHSSVNYSIREYLNKYLECNAPESIDFKSLKYITSEFNQAYYIMLEEMARDKLISCPYVVYCNRKPNIRVTYAHYIKHNNMITNLKLGLTVIKSTNGLDSDEYIIRKELYINQKYNKKYNYIVDKLFSFYSTSGFCGGIEYVDVKDGERLEKEIRLFYAQSVLELRYAGRPSLILIGRPGTGKTYFGNLFYNSIFPEMTVMEEAGKNFSMQTNKTFLIFDEAEAGSDDVKQKKINKKMCRADTLEFEYKGKDRGVIKNCGIPIYTSNGNPLPPETDSSEDGDFAYLYLNLGNNKITHCVLTDELNKAIYEAYGVCDIMDFMKIQLAGYIRDSLLPLYLRTKLDDLGVLRDDARFGFKIYKNRHYADIHHNSISTSKQMMFDEIASFLTDCKIIYNDNDGLDTYIEKTDKDYISFKCWELWESSNIILNCIFDNIADKNSIKEFRNYFRINVAEKKKDAFCKITDAKGSRKSYRGISVETNSHFSTYINNIIEKTYNKCISPKKSEISIPF